MRPINHNEIGLICINLANYGAPPCTKRCGENSGFATFSRSEYDPFAHGGLTTAIFTGEYIIANHMIRTIALLAKCCDDSSEFTVYEFLVFHTLRPCGTAS